MEIHFWKTDDRRFPENTSATYAAARCRRSSRNSSSAVCRTCRPSR
jgi:hypothetical protein